MKRRIREVLQNHKLTVLGTKTLYVTDYKDLRVAFGRSDVDISSNEIEGIKSVTISNENEVEVCFDGFPENALPLDTPGKQNKQCECVLFPNNCLGDYWILFIEMKYANDIIQAFRKENNYPHCMVNQVIETVRYFRNKNIIADNKKVNAIVSFPNLINEFNSTLFKGGLSIEDILFEHRIKIRGTNSAIIKSEKTIKI
jgi:hypothetical protein